MSTKINPKLKNTLNVGGNGLWSNTIKKVKISKMEVHYYCTLEEQNDIPTYGELRVFFHKRSWDVSKCGLIYTDRAFLKELNKWLSNLKINDKADYSEQGMQGSNYVSLDIGKKFIADWYKRKFKVVKKIVKH
jgi:hypothetical protein